jgi:hypothetical protein
MPHIHWVARQNKLEIPNQNMKGRRKRKKGKKQKN